MNLINANERELLVFDVPYNKKAYELGGIRRFEDMAVGTAKELLRKGYVDPCDAQNLSPTAQEMIDFCDDGSDKWYLHGYVVSPEREDCRITFEGVGSHGILTAQEALDFMSYFRYADNISADIGGSAYCWYD